MNLDDLKKIQINIFFLLSRCTLLQINTLLEQTNKYNNKQRANNPRSSILGQYVFLPRLLELLYCCMHF